MGRTQGETNESKPKKKAVNIPGISKGSVRDNRWRLSQHTIFALKRQAFGGVAELLPDDPHLHLRRDACVELHVDRVDPERLDRLLELDRPLVDGDPFFLYRLCDHL